MISSCQIGLRWSSTVSGGAERVFADLAASLPEAGVNFVGAVAGSPDLNIKTSGLIHAFAPEDSGMFARLRGARRNIGRLLDDQNPDLLASHFAFYTVPVAHRLRERPFVMHFHGPWALESQVEGGSALAVAGKRKLEEIVYRRADRAIVLSHAFATLLHREYGVAEEQIRVVPGAVDLDRFAPVQSRSTARDILQWPKDRPILLSIRRLVHRMGLRQLVEAIPLIRMRVPEVLCYLAGTGPIRQELKTLVKDLGIQDNVQFLGFLPDALLPLTYRAANLSVVPTRALEGFGLVAAESLAAGTPAMVTRVGGLPEVVEQLCPDLIFPSGSPSDLAQGLSAALLGEIELPSEAACRNYAERRFSRGLMASQVAAVYRECIG